MFYTEDWLGSTKVLAMKPLEEYAYFRLLLLQAGSDNCCIPADDETLAQYSRLTARQWQKTKAKVLACFDVLPDGRLQNARLLVEWERQMSYEKQHRDAGKKGGLAKRNVSAATSAATSAASSPAVQVREVGEEERTPTSGGSSDLVVSKEKKTRTLSPFYDHSALCDRLVAIYPPGHNPRPDFAVQMLISKLDSVTLAPEVLAERGEQMFVDLRDKWLPRMKPQGWQTPHDLHNWIARWEPGADVAPDPKPETQSERIVRELEEEEKRDENTSN